MRRRKRGRSAQKLKISVIGDVIFDFVCISNVLQIKGKSHRKHTEMQNFRLRRQGSKKGRKKTLIRF